jgi:hypothetical protein
LKFARSGERFAVGESLGDHLPSIVAQAEPISQKLREITGGVRPVAFSHVTEPAQALLAATLAGELRKTAWILCPSVRSQELLYESLLNWQPNALFPSCGVRWLYTPPDPEIGGRPALFNRVQREGPHLIVTTRSPRPTGSRSSALKQQCWFFAAENTAP